MVSVIQAALVNEILCQVEFLQKLSLFETFSLQLAAFPPPPPDLPVVISDTANTDYPYTLKRIAVQEDIC